MVNAKLGCGVKHLCLKCPVKYRPSFSPTDDIAGTGCGLKDNFVCSKLSVHLIIMPITSQSREKGGGGGLLKTSLHREDS